MTVLEAIILGIIQGLTEFLPVSSDGHLELGKVLLGLGRQEDPLLFTIVVHAATTLSIIVVFWPDIVQIVRDLLRFEWNDNTRFSFYVLVSMIPAGLVGILLRDWLESLFQGRLALTGSMLLLSGLFLWLSSRLRASHSELSVGKALLIGVFQAAAMLPGLSRSGSTVSASLMLGVDRHLATRFSFLMVVPVILGGTLLEVRDYIEAGGPAKAGAIGAIPLAVGFITAFVFGLIACRWMIQAIRKSKLDYFAIYCFIVGSIAIVAGLIWQ